MSIKSVLFDLDGTLLPMDQDVFIGTYFKGLAGHLIPRGYDPERLIKVIWQGTEAMIKNDGSCNARAHGLGRSLFRGFRAVHHI